MPTSPRPVNRSSIRIKPPIGLRPWFITDLERRREIVAAMFRYDTARKDVPIEWEAELLEILRRAQSRKEKEYAK